MFSLKYYNASPKDLKAEVVFTRGSLIDEYPTNKVNQTIALYSLDTFYIEVTFDNACNEVIDLVGIIIEDAIKPY